MPLRAMDSVMFDSLWEDIRYAGRLLRRSPGIESASVADFVPLRMVEGRSRLVAVDGYEPGPGEDMRLA